MRESRDISKLPRAHENHCDARELYESQRAYCIYFLKEKQNKTILFAYSFDMRIESIIPNTTRRDTSHQNWEQHKPHAQEKSQWDQCGWSPGWPQWTGWMLRSWGALIFCLRVFTCMFIKNCSPSRQPSTGFSMWATVLYYTWHLSIKEETLLKQTEVKLVLSSTSDLPLLLSSKGKFVLEQC